jgi:hypothetical protein
MSLLEDVRTWYKNQNYPPDGPELDSFWDEDSQKWVEKGTETILVSKEDHGELRWGTSFINVYKRDDELVAVQDVRPATEMQDWGDYGEPEIYPVKERTETIVKTFYDKVV